LAHENSPRIFLAYDGSINADWVSRYAIRIAANTQNRKLFLLHILDGTYSTEQINLKINAIEAECAFQHVELGHSILPFSRNVPRTLLQSIPHGPHNFCICGSRITSRGKGFLTGTISEKLLRAKKFNVLAIRVVQPGLLGCPNDLLIPLMGIKVSGAASLPFYRLLAPDIKKVHFLLVVYANPWLLRYRPLSFLRTARDRGFESLRKVLADMKEPDHPPTVHLDGKVVVSSDWVRETLVQASKLHTQLILLEDRDQRTLANWLQQRRIERILRNTTCDVALCKTV